MPANSRLTLELETKAFGQESVDRLTAALDRFSTSAENAGRRPASALSSGISGVGTAAETAEKKVHGFVGAIPGMGVAAERFIGLIPGLGEKLVAAFPVFGAIAFLEGIQRLYPAIKGLIDEVDPLAHAQKHAADTAKEWADEIRRLGEEIGKLDIEAFTRVVGKGPGAINSANALSRSAADDRRFAALKLAEIKQAEIDIAGAEARAKRDNQDPKITAAEMGTAMRLRLELSALQKEATFFQLRAAKAEQQASALLANSSEEQLKSIADHAKEASKQAADRNKRIAAYGTAATLAETNSPIARALIQSRDEHNGLVAEGVGANLLVAQGEAGAAAVRAAARKEQEKWAGQYIDEGIKAFSEGRAILEKRFANDITRQIQGGERLQSSAERVRASILADNAQDFNSIRATSAHFEKMASLNAEPGGETAALREALKLRQDGIEAERAIIQLTESGYEMDREMARLDLAGQQARWDFEERIAELRKKGVAEWRENVVRGFDDLVSGRGGNILKSFAVGIERQVIGNIATMIYPSIQKATSGLHIGGGIFGRILQGTPFGTDPLKGATDQNTAATIANTQALLARGGSSAAGAIGAIGQGGLFSGPDPNNPGIWHYTGTGADGLPTRGTTMGGIAAGFPGMATGGGWLSTASKYAGAATMAVGGSMAAIHGFSRGGLSGALEGTAGLAAVASGVLPLISKSLAAAGPIGAIAGLGIGLVMGMLGDPKQKRQNEIDAQLQNSVYHAPQAINATMDGSGHYVDFDSRSNLRRSTLSGMPQTRNPYTRWQDGQPYEAPGRETSPYTVIQHIYQPGSIQTMDASSFHEFARRNSDAIADVTADHLGNSESKLSGAIRYLASA